MELLQTLMILPVIKNEIPLTLPIIHFKGNHFIYQWFKRPSVLPSLKQMIEEHKSVNKNQRNAYKYSPEPVWLKKSTQQHHSHYKSRHREKFQKNQMLIWKIIKYRWKCNFGPPKIVLTSVWSLNKNWHQFSMWMPFSSPKSCSLSSSLNRRLSNGRHP